VSAFERVLGGIKDLLVMREDVARLAEGTRELGRDIRDHERRLIRIETLIEIAERRALPRD
jgi:hypothetical protein